MCRVRKDGDKLNFLTDPKVKEMIYRIQLSGNHRKGQRSRGLSYDLWVTTMWLCLIYSQELCARKTPNNYPQQNCGLTTFYN